MNTYVFLMDFAETICFIMVFQCFQTIKPLKTNNYSEGDLPSPSLGGGREIPLAIVIGLQWFDGLMV